MSGTGGNETTILLTMLRSREQLALISWAAVALLHGAWPFFCDTKRFATASPAVGQPLAPLARFSHDETVRPPRLPLRGWAASSNGVQPESHAWADTVVPPHK